MLKSRLTLTAAVLAAISLTGCATQAQIEEQNKQLVAINVSLAQIQANQAAALAQQKVQTSVLIETHNLQVGQQKK